MRAASDTITDVTPRAAEPPPDHVMERLRRLGTERAEVEAELRAAVLEALNLGGSVRTVAEAAGLSPTTVQAWKNGR
jgi:hypothetical protein